MSKITETGIYFGYARVCTKDEGHALDPDDDGVFPMVMSLGWNPFYKNERMTAVS
jgi:riboflavin kinase